MNKSGEKLEALQAMQRSPKIKVGFGFTGQSSGIKEKEKVIFVEEKGIAERPAHHSLPDKRIKLKSPTPQPQSILVKKHSQFATKNQQFRQPTKQQKVERPIQTHGWTDNKKGSQPVPIKAQTVDKKKTSASKHRYYQPAHKSQNYYEQWPNHQDYGYAGYWNEHQQ